MKLYADFYRWTHDTSEQLRRSDFGEIDVAALVEEVEDLGKSPRSREATIQLQRSSFGSVLRAIGPC